MTNTELLFDAEDLQDPVEAAQSSTQKNRAKVGSARPSSLLYTYGPGAIMDLPNFSVMPTGLDNWETIYRRMPRTPTISEPRLLETVKLHLGKQVSELRAFPWQPQENSFSTEGANVGVPAHFFPQWLRCTGCNKLARNDKFAYKNTNPYKPYEAQFTHEGCPGPALPKSATQNRRARQNRNNSYPAVAAPILLACEYGHLDEFPYELWVHQGGNCPKAENPALKMLESNMGRNVGSTIVCTNCKARRSIAEAQGAGAKKVLPAKCRGRHPHLNAYTRDCQGEPTLMMMGASNLWFPVTQSVIVMPRGTKFKKEDLLDRLIGVLGKESLLEDIDDPRFVKRTVERDGIDATLEEVTEALSAFKRSLQEPTTEEEETRKEELKAWDPTGLLEPEWDYLQRPIGSDHSENNDGLMLTEKTVPATLETRGVTKVIAVDKLKKVNALIGFTRLDEYERGGDKERLVQLTRTGKPTWVPAIEDRGEGIYLQFDTAAIDRWEEGVEGSALWQAHVEAHERNFRNRFSRTAKNVDHETRLPAPRYWLLHTLAHALIRQMAMDSGYGAASLAERIYAWKADPEKDRESAAGILISTTASDSEGTLGGLVSLAAPEKISAIMRRALDRSCRCSSDPVCAHRTPREPEDFLHGAACHNCSFASETSCERANRFLDRRFLVTLPGSEVDGFFGGSYV